jgi:hypothetical protein
MKLRDILIDAIGVICLFGTGYLLLLLGHGVGL